MKRIEIPLPSLSEQQEIVETLDAEAAIVKGNNKLVEIYEDKSKSVLTDLWGER